MAIGDLYRITAVFTNADTPGKFVRTHFDYKQFTAGAPSIAQAGDLVKAWWNSDQGGGAGQQASHGIGISLDHVDLRRIEPLEAVVQTYTTGLPIAGTAVGGQSMSPRDAVLVSLRTGLIGRAFRGRCYLPPINDGFITANGDVQAAQAEGMLDQFEGGILNAINNIASFSQTMVVVHAHSGHTLRTKPNGTVVAIPTPVSPKTGTAITSIKLDQRLRSQRKRQVRTASYVAP
jgi:hypothetical protein